MIKKLKDNSLAIGLGLTIALAAFVMGLSIPLFLDPTREPFLFHVGVDTMGSLVCAALFFGCMKQSGEGTRTFRALIIFVSACFAVMPSEGFHVLTELPACRGRRTRRTPLFCKSRLSC